MSPATFRSFFACEISQEILKEIGNLQAELKHSLPRSVKWVNPGNLHLTIKFIGEFKTTHLEMLKTSLFTALEDIPPFKMEIKGLGVFPSYKKPRIIWLGINAEKPLVNLVQIVDRECAQIGYPREKRPFSAHITLGRIKSYATREDHKMIVDMLRTKETIVIGNQTVDSLHFIKSDLTPNGPIYKNMVTFPLTP